MRNTITRIAVGALALAGIVSTATVVSPAAHADEPQWTVVDDDFVVSAPPSVNGLAGPGESPDGFAYFDDYRINKSYTIRLITSTDVDKLRAPLAAVVDQVKSIAGVTLTLAAGTVAPKNPDPGEITVVVSTSSPCTGEWAGCGGVIGGGGRWVSGNVWIHPMSFGYTAAQLRHVVMHEMGHALGLAHYAKTYQGSPQMMHPSLYEATDYRPGDANGLRFGVGSPKPGVPVVADAVSQRGSTFTVRDSYDSWAGSSSFIFGDPGDLPVFCDWNGNGAKSVGVFRPSNHTWYLSNDNRTAFTSFAYADPTDIPVCGDWNGDGKAEVGVYRPASADFYLRSTITASFVTDSLKYGNPRWLPVTGDWTKRGIDTVGVVDPATMTWYQRNSNTTGTADQTIRWGQPGDTPVVGDWYADGTDGVGVVHGTGWSLYPKGGSGVVTNFTFGAVGDRFLTR